MGRVSKPITPDESTAAYAAAVAMARDVIGTERDFVPPQARVGSLSDWEWKKLAYAMVSGWIIQRSKQLTEERFSDDNEFLATGEVPEPQELGICAVTLPPLGELVEKLGLTDEPIGAWSKDNILLFVWTCWNLVEEAIAKRNERPGPAEIVPETDYLMAG